MRNDETGFRLFVGYVIFAGIATLVDIGLLYFFTDIIGIWYFYSALIASTAGMVVNYSLNKYLNFANRSRQIILQFGMFAAVAGVGIFLNQIILYTLVEFAHIYYLLAKIITVFIVMFWSFWGHKRFTFYYLQ